MNPARLLRRYVDSAYYFERYREEVLRSSLHPLDHFLKLGARQGHSFSPLFWDDWYAARNPDAATSGVRVAVHYVKFGWKDGRKPNPLFDPKEYRSAYPDVGALRIEPLLHFRTVGWREGRSPHLLFDTAWYLQELGVENLAGTDPLSHFLQRGGSNGISPHALFDTSWYLTRNPDVAAQGANPLVHYLESGWREGRLPHPLFDPAFYLRQNPDVEAQGVEPLSHFLVQGWKEQRCPHPLFDLQRYLGMYPDVAAAQVNPLVHFVSAGWKERRSPHRLFDAAWYRAQTPDLPETVNPLVHFVSAVDGEATSPHPLFDSSLYLAENPDVRQAGLNPLIHFVSTGWRDGRRPRGSVDLRAILSARPDLLGHGIDAVLDALESPSLRALAQGTSVVQLMIDERMWGIRPLRVLDVSHGPRRITLVTDTLDDGSFFGGVATSLILATKLAAASGRALRIVCRSSYPNAENYWRLLDLQGLQRPDIVEFYSDFDYLKANYYRLEVSPNDVFLTTSWWSTYAVRRSDVKRRSFYLLQECETMFYPHGDDQLLARSILEDETLSFFINSRLLYHHLMDVEGYSHLSNTGVPFEPAFPRSSFSAPAGAFQPRDRHRLFYYARPNNPRNLYLTGLKLLDDATSSGLIDTERIEICFAGADVPAFSFSNGYQPTLLGKLPISDYLTFLRTVDLALCLMFTPHPSYPPLDVAATGGVVLTNQFAGKKNLDAYSRNILCLDLLDDRGTERAVRQALELMVDGPRRRQNYEESGLTRTWDEGFANVVRFFLDRTGNH